MRRLCSAGRALRQRGGLPREGVGSPAPGVSKERLGVGRGAGFGGWQWWQGVVGAGELGGWRSKVSERSGCPLHHISSIFDIDPIYLKFWSTFVTTYCHRPAGKLPLSNSFSVPDTAKFNIDFVVALLRQENAKDICVIEVPPEMKYCNYFIVVSGSSTRHLHAMANYMMKMYKLQKEDSDPRAQIEGKETDDWLCIDFGSIVVHFMLPEARETYELEKLWTLGSYDDQLTQMTPQSLPEDFVLGLTSQQQWEGSPSLGFKC
uniref:Mitochondrial assembly of ribosomal large subunit protein 1 n=1 Tax=Anas platyrhynchos TaxID=8839 RepID=A0A8B9QQC1_ANAPL